MTKSVPYTANRLSKVCTHDVVGVTRPSFGFTPMVKGKGYVRCIYNFWRGALEKTGRGGVVGRGRGKGQEERGRDRCTERKNDRDRETDKDAKISATQKGTNPEIEGERERERDSAARWR